MSRILNQEDFGERKILAVDVRFKEKKFHFRSSELETVVSSLRERRLLEVLR